MKTTVLFIFLLGEPSIWRSLAIVSHAKFGKMTRTTGKWTHEFDADTAIKSGLDVNFFTPRRLDPAYVCQAYSYEHGNDSSLFVGAYQEEGNCCLIAIQERTQICVGETADRKIRYLLAPTKEQKQTLQWIPQREGDLSLTLSDKIVIGGLEELTPFLICRFPFTNADDQDLILQGRIRVDIDTECRAGQGYYDKKDHHIRSKTYELLVFTSQ